jgi:benzoyl-CoA reductase/2-hydroxyglutaryl-CoA dehydratase subunit BcrC/BadD/HgdB
MKTIAYCSPFVPPEWITAHGLQPSWISPRSTGDCAPIGAVRGLCPFARALINESMSGGHASALVLTTTCDQTRYAAALLERTVDRPIFLMNVPSTWQTAAAEDLYLEELKRLGRLLVPLGGASPSNEALANVMLDYDRARSDWRAARDGLSAEQYCKSVARLRGNGAGLHQVESEPVQPSGVPLALVGGPLLEKDYAIAQLIEQAGGRLTLDATESGERTLPAPFDQRRVREDPLGELARAYFGTIPDIFRRPNDGFYEWLGRELRDRDVRGIVFRRYVWCDNWHAELDRLRRWSSIPVVDIDVCEDGGSLSHAAGRIEALVEMLR